MSRCPLTITNVRNAARDFPCFCPSPKETKPNVLNVRVAMCVSSLPVFYTAAPVAVPEVLPAVAAEEVAAVVPDVDLDD